MVLIWNVGTAEELYRLEGLHPDIIYSVSWSRDGARFCTACKDKSIRIIDPRRGTVVAVSVPPLSPAETRHPTRVPKAPSCPGPQGETLPPPQPCRCPLVVPTVPCPWGVPCSLPLPRVLGRCR